MSIDVAPTSACLAAPINGVDQRGYVRNVNGIGGASTHECDIGAFEFQSTGPQPEEDVFYVSARKAGTIGNLRFKPEAALRAMLESIGVTPDKEVIVHCQTHHRSAHTSAVLKSLGYERVRGYDGSWSEWGNDPDTPVET